MRKTQTIGGGALVFVLFLLLNSFLPGELFAIEYGGVGGQPAQFRAEEPKSKNIFIHTVQPGQTLQESIIVYNLDGEGEEKTLEIQGVDAIHSSGGGVACAQALDEQKEVGTWIALEKTEVQLAASQRETIPFTISAPEEIEAGEYNGCIVIKEQKNEGGTGLSLSTRVGIRVALTIPGELRREIVEPTIVRSIRENGDFIFQISGRNTGNVSVDTTVSLKLRSLATGVLLLEQGGGYPVYRGKTQQWNFDVKKPFWGGPYVVSTSLSYDPKNGGEAIVLKAPKIFLFILPHPIALVIEGLVLVALLCSFILWRRKKRSAAVKKAQRRAQVRRKVQTRKRPVRSRSTK